MTNTTNNLRYLHKRQPLLLDPDLACLIGINEAIVLQQIEYWLSKNEDDGRNYIDGKYWTYNSVLEWQKQFKFWSPKTITRTLDSLEKSGILISANHNKNKFDRTKWYAIDYNKFNSLIPPNPFGQIDQMGLVKESKSYISITEISTETSSSCEEKKEEENLFMFEGWMPTPRTNLNIKKKHACSDAALKVALKDFIKFYMANKQEKVDWDKAFENWCCNRKSWPEPIIPSKTSFPPLGIAPKPRKQDSVTKSIEPLIIEEFKKQFDEEVMTSWISHLKFQCIEGATLIISVPTKFIRTWVIDNYLQVIENIIKSVNPNIHNIDVRLSWS
jgi:hypothetical protein